MHNITQTDKQEGLKQAWHGLTVIREGLSLAVNWLREWDIMQAPLFLQPGEIDSAGYMSGAWKETPFRQLVASDDRNVLIGYPFNPETFRPLTNAEFLNMIQEAVSGTDHKLQSIGTIRNRGRRFASFEMVNLEKFTAGGRKFEPFLNFGDGCDKSSVLWANTSNICTVCDNTFSMNLASTEAGRGALTVSERHTKNIMFRLPAISKLIDQAIGVQAEFAAAFEKLATQPVTMTQAARVYAGFIAAPDVEKMSQRTFNIANRLTDLFIAGKGNKGESRADLLSGATEYFTHENSGKSTNRARQFASADFGTGAQRKVDFMALVTNDDRMGKAEARGAELFADWTQPK
jgi:hypothetical protein